MSESTDVTATVRSKSYPWIQPMAVLSVGEDKPPGPETSEPQACWIQHLALRGIVVICKDRPANDAPLAVELRAASRNASLGRAAQVKSSALLPSGRWLVACEFASPLAEEDLESLR
jgi:hypothetical protein